MSNRSSTRLLILAAVLCPLAAFAQSGGSGGGSGGGASAGGATGGAAAGTGSTAGSSAGLAGAANPGVSGVPSGPGNVGGLNNSVTDPSGAGRPPGAPGTNTLGTANSTGAAGGATGTTTGLAGNRSGANGGRIDGTVTQGPSMRGDLEIREENSKVDAKIKGICKGC
jgi:hypothetical protein